MILSTKWKRLGWNLNKTEQSKILEINIVCVFWFGFLLLMETKKKAPLTPKDSVSRSLDFCFSLFQTLGNGGMQHIFYYYLADPEVFKTSWFI